MLLMKSVILFVLPGGSINPFFDLVVECITIQLKLISNKQILIKTFRLSYRQGETFVLVKHHVVVIFFALIANLVKNCIITNFNLTSQEQISLKSSE